MTLGFLVIFYDDILEILEGKFWSFSLNNAELLIFIFSIDILLENK
jgi:hypothetical protein